MVPSRPAVLTLVAWAVIAVGITWLVAVGGGFGGIYGPGLRIISVTAVAVALVGWLAAAVRQPSWRPSSTIWPALLVPLAAFAVTTVASERPRVSAEYLAYAVLLVSLYLLLRSLLAHAAFRERIAGFVVLLAAAIGIVYIVVVGGRWITWWETVGALRLPPLRPFFESLTYGNPSAVLTMSVLLTASAVAHVGWATRARSGAAAGLVVLSTAVALLSGSRAGWLALAITVFVVGAAAVIGPLRRSWRGWVPRTRLARLAIVVGLVMSAALAAGLAPGILSRFGAGGEDVRATYYTVAGRMFADSPVTGAGAGSWVADRTTYTPRGETDYYIPHAHSLYVQTAAEHGILGLAAGALAIACLAWLIIGGLRDVDPVRRRWGWAAFFASVYFGTHQLLDFYPNMPAALFAFAVPIAWLDATAGSSVPTFIHVPVAGAAARRLGRLAAGAVGVFIVSGAVVGLLLQEPAAQTMARGRIAADEGDWSAALPYLREAQAADPDMPAYAFARGLAEARAGNDELALDLLTRVAEEDDLPVAWLDVAALRLAREDAAGARTAIDRALRLGCQQPAITLAGGWLLEQLGDTAGADAAWTTTLQLMPLLAGDPWWLEPERAERWPAVRDAALGPRNASCVTQPFGPDEDWQPAFAATVWLALGDRQRALVEAARVRDPEYRDPLQLAIRAWDGAGEDRAAMATYAQDHPLDLSAVRWAGLLAAHHNDPSALAAYRTWFDGLTTRAGGNIGIPRVLGPEDRAGRPVDDLAGLSGVIWGQFTYRRPTPADQLLPSLPRIVQEPGRRQD